MRVSQATKDAFWDRAEIKLYIYVGGSSEHIPFSNIVGDSMVLNEALTSGGLDFSGCVSSEFNVELANVSGISVEDSIVVNIQAGNTDVIPLFTGYIEKIEVLPALNHVKIVAFDIMKKYRKTDIVSWYETNAIRYDENGERVSSDIHIVGHFMEKLYSDYKIICMRNNWNYPIPDPKYPIYIETKENPYTYIMADYLFPFREMKMSCYADDIKSSMSLTDAIRYFCELNGVAAIIDRYGRLSYRAQTDYSSDGSSARVGYESLELIRFYKSQHQDLYNNRPIVGARGFRFADEQNMAYLKLPDGQVRLMVEGNFFMERARALIYVESNIDWANANKTAIQNVSQFTNNNTFSVTTVGLPWIECGLDRIRFEYLNFSHIESSQNFFVTKRTLRGIQNLTDTFSFENNLDTLSTVNGGLQTQIANLQQAIVSRPSSNFVTELPESMNSNTIYFVKKG